MRFERGDIVVTNESYPVHQGVMAVVIVPVYQDNSVGVNWLVHVPKNEMFRKFHPTFDRCIDKPEWLTKIGHIDLDAAEAAQEGEEHGNRRKSETGS